jgi:hypothetical protein
VNGKPSRPWPDFDARAWIQGQLTLALSAELLTVPEAREAIESLADDDLFWAHLQPMLRAVEDSMPGIVADAESRMIAADAERRKRGLS